MGCAMLHAAVVVGADGVYFFALEPEIDLLLVRLSAYVRARAPYTLWTDDALRVEHALAAGMNDVAVDAYFAAVGRRWDQELIFRFSVAWASDRSIRRSGTSQMSAATT